MNTYTIGDIHGEVDKLKGLLKLINFDYENDRLIQLGDVVDRGSSSYEVVEELLKIKNLVAIRGNHDSCWFDYLKGLPSVLWNQGANETWYSYERNGIKPEVHFDFFKNQVNYYIDEDNNLYVHGGFNRHKHIDEQEEHVYYWDRDLFLAALSYESMKDNEHPFKMKDEFNTIFIGHTPTIYWEQTTPIKAANIINVDTGCGKGDYPLTAINVRTKEIFQFK